MCGMLGKLAFALVVSLASNAAQLNHADAVWQAEVQTEPQGAVVQAPAPEALFDRLPYKDWRLVGGAAKFELLPPADGGVGPTLVGRGPIERNGFLVSPRTLGNFRLVVDVRLGSASNPKGEKMNSGIQIRSGEKGGSIAGLQVEVDPTPRRWSGGIYDERGRLWLAPLRDNEPAQAAFKLGEWNTYEIECDGPRIRTRVNGVPCAEWFDGIVDGVLAFQVHGGPECEVAFRAPTIQEFGRHAWRAMTASAAASSGERVAWSSVIASSAEGVRLDVTGTGRVELLDEAGKSMASFDFAPRAVVRDSKGEQRPASDLERARAQCIEVLWKDVARVEGADGSILLDGAKMSTLALPAQPKQVRVIGADATVAKPEELVGASR